jgi:Putative adhesin
LRFALIAIYREFRQTRYIAREEATVAQEKWLVAGPKTIDVENVRKLKVSLISGQVDIVGHDEPGVRVEIHSVSGRDLKVAVEGDTLEVDHPQLNWDNWLDVFKSFRGNARADVSIMVPRDVSLKFGVVNAEALVSGIHDNASISTVNGDLVIDSMRGDIQINSVSGEISVRNHAGRLAVHSVNGDITASGAIEGMTAEVVTGDVYLDVTGIPDELRLSTVSGHVTARLDAEVPVSYTINTVNGRLQLDDSEISGVRGRYTGKYGTLDGRWLDFRANTVTGNVSVLHTARPTAEKVNAKKKTRAKETA